MKLWLETLILKFVWIGLLLCVVPVSANESEDYNTAFFISEIFKKYGSNESITYEGFEHLLENLGLGELKFDKRHDVSLHKVNGTFVEIHESLALHKHDLTYSDKIKKADKNFTDNDRRRRSTLKVESSHNNSDRKKCLTPQDILITYGLPPDRDVVISPSKYVEICPSIVYELDQKFCVHQKPSKISREREDSYLVWIYATLSILIMGASGILCVLIVPIIRKNSYPSLIQFLVSLAVGTLCGDALIHLLPQVYSNNDNSNPNLYQSFKGIVTLLGIFMFFTLENILKGLKTLKEKDVDSIKELGKMITTLEMNEQNFEYQKKHGHLHSHGGDIKTVAWMAIMGDVLHNVTDGIAIGAAFTSSLSSGFASSIAIFCHELPHELGDYAILISSGMSIKKSLFYNLLSSLFSFIGMVAGVLLGEIENASQWINAFTAGTFLYISLADLIPEITSNSKPKIFLIQLLGICCGGVLMFSIALYEDDIENIL